MVLREGRHIDNEARESRGGGGEGGAVRFRSDTKSGKGGGLLAVR